MKMDKAEKQKERAKEMLGISDSRAKEIFEEQPDRKQQKKKELEEKGKLDSSESSEPDETEEPESEAQEEAEEDEDEVELHACPECGDEFDSEQGMKVHKGQKH